jgi:hypothetical protein
VRCGLAIALLVLSLGACRKRHAQRDPADWDERPQNSAMSEAVPWWAFWHMFNAAQPAAQHYGYNEQTTAPPAHRSEPEPEPRPVVRQPPPAPQPKRYSTPAPTPRYSQPSTPRYSQPSKTPRYSSGGNGGGGGSRYSSGNRR